MNIFEAATVRRVDLGQVKTFAAEFGALLPRIEQSIACHNVRGYTFVSGRTSNGERVSRIQGPGGSFWMAPKLAERVDSIFETANPHSLVAQIRCTGVGAQLFRLTSKGAYLVDPPESKVDCQSVWKKGDGSFVVSYYSSLPESRRVDGARCIALDRYGRRVEQGPNTGVVLLDEDRLIPENPAAPRSVIREVFKSHAALRFTFECANHGTFQFLISEGAEPVSVTPLPNGTFFIVQRNPAKIWHLHPHLDELVDVTPSTDKNQFHIVPIGHCGRAVAIGVADGDTALSNCSIHVIARDKRAVPLNLSALRYHPWHTADSMKLQLSQRRPDSGVEFQIWGDVETVYYVSLESSKFRLSRPAPIRVHAPSSTRASFSLRHFVTLSDAREIFVRRGGEWFITDADGEVQTVNAQFVDSHRSGAFALEGGRILTNSIALRTDFRRSEQLWNVVDLTDAMNPRYVNKTHFSQVQPLRDGRYLARTSPLHNGRSKLVVIERSGELTQWRYANFHPKQVQASPDWTYAYWLSLEGDLRQRSIFRADVDTGEVSVFRLADERDIEAFSVSCDGLTLSYVASKEQDAGGVEVPSLPVGAFVGCLDTF